MRSLTLLTLMAIATLAMSAQELKLPALSPTCTIKQGFSTSNIEIVYSRPSMRGRKIFGDLVPFGKVWRTGANAATKITFEEKVEIAGNEVPAGTYSFYTIPGEHEWEIIINKNTGSWGAYGYAKSDDVARIKMPSQRIQDVVETFSINIINITFSSCEIELLWENTRVTVPVVCRNQERLAAEIDKVINHPVIPYHQAATYLYESHGDLKKALEYSTKATEQSPKAYWTFMLKARIAARLGDKATARQAAEQAMNVAKGTPAEQEYQHLATELIKSL